jgi:hypothetical protein
MISNTSYIFFLLFSAVSSFCFGNGLLFDSESVSVEVKFPDTVSVNGTYCLVNPSVDHFAQMIFYPFPVDSTMKYPFSIVVHQKDSIDTIPYSKKADGIFFFIDVEPKKSALFKVVYSQQVKGQNGKYILLTTREWNRPLRRSNLMISIPDKSGLTYISYDVDTVFSTNKRLNYQFKFKDFMPSKDMMFSW